MDDLTGRVALVTGSSRGIGRAITFALARSGADIAINFLHRAAEAAAVEHQVRETGRRAISIQADISSASGVNHLVATARARLGPIDILVNNAGIAPPQAIDELTEQDWDHVLDSNLKSCFLLTQAVLPSMSARGWGRIVNLSSVAAHLGGVVGPHYAASKAGLAGLTHFYARSLAGQGITVNTIAPALIETEMVTRNPNASPSLIPLGRYGTPDEVASVALMLAQNAYITGQTIHVNGGWYMT